MKKIDYKLYNASSFNNFIKGQLSLTFNDKSVLSQKLKQVESLLEAETTRLTGKTFFVITTSLGLNLADICKQFFKNIPSTKLKSLKSSENKLEDLFGIFFNAKTDLVTASCIMETTLNELFKNKFDRIYAYEVCALAIAFGIEPHILFEYFYGDGERPVIGLLPKPAEGKEN